MTPKIFVLCSYPLKQVGSVQSDNTAGSIYELSAGKKMSAGISCLPLTQELLPLCFYLGSGAYRTTQWCWFNSLPQQKVHLAKMKPPVNRSWVSTLKSKLREPAVSKGRKGRAGADIFGLPNHQRSSAALSLLCHYFTRSTSGPAPFLYQERYVSVAIIQYWRRTNGKK